MKNVLIDTSVILDGIENVTMLDKKDNVFVTDVVLRELDGNKNAQGSKGYNAREFFRQLNQNDFSKLKALPLTGQRVANNDTLTEGEISSGAHVYTISRKWYRSKDINDSRIIEMADDYKLTLTSFDQAQCARAKSQGVDAITMERKEFYTMKSDVLVVGALAVIISVSLSVVVFETMQGALAPFISLCVATVGSIPLVFFIKKVIGSNGSDLSKVLTAVSLFGSYFAFFMAFITMPLLFSLMGVVLFLVGVYATSNLNVVFDSMDARYNAPEKQDDQSDKEHKFDNYFDEVHKRQDYGLE